MSVGAVRASGSPSAFESRPIWQVPHLFDLLTGLLDWNPHERLGTTGGASQLMQHEYWGETDWELAGIRRLASPLRTEASRRVAARQKRWAQEAEDTSSGAPAKMDAIVKKLTKGQLQGSDRTSQRGRISQLSSFDTKASNGDGSEASPQVQGLDENEVDGWDFVSEQAVAQEYVETASNVVSIV